MDRKFEAQITKQDVSGVEVSVTETNVRKFKSLDSLRRDLLKERVLYGLGTAVGLVMIGTGLYTGGEVLINFIKGQATIKDATVPLLLSGPGYWAFRGALSELQSGSAVLKAVNTTDANPISPHQ